MQEVIRWGLVGCGDIAERRVVPALQSAKDSKLLACVRKQPEKLRDFQHRHGIAKGYLDPLELFADPEIDAVYLATPVFLHCLHTIQAAEHRKHILCEKPMAMDTQECERMIVACRHHGVKLGIAYYRRFYPVVLKIKELLEKQVLGKVILVRATLVEHTAVGKNAPAIWRFVPDQGGGGLLMDTASHRLDLLCMFFGQPLSVSALTHTRDLDIPVEDTGSLLIEFPGGVHAMVFASHCINQSMDEFEIFGTLGRIRVPSLNGSELQVATDSHTTLDLPKAGNVHQPLVEDFNQAIRDDRRPITSGEEGMKASSLLEAAYHAARERIVVRLQSPRIVE